MALSRNGRVGGTRGDAGRRLARLPEAGGFAAGLFFALVPWGTKRIFCFLIFGLFLTELSDFFQKQAFLGGEMSVFYLRIPPGQDVVCGMAAPPAAADVSGIFRVASSICTSYQPEHLAGVWFISVLACFRGICAPMSSSPAVRFLSK